MVIAKGEPWGAEIARPPDVPVAAGDSELAGLVTRHRRGDYAVTGGDLHATVGGPTAVGGLARRLPVDVLHVITDRGEWAAVAHVVARRRWWRGRIVAALNVGYLGRWNVAPSAHPNDGRFEAIDVDPAMRWRERLEALRRLPAGTHLPHPAIGVRHVEHAAWSFDPAVRCVIDGADRGTITTLSVTIEPDAFNLIV